MRTRPTDDEIESATDNFPEAWEVIDWEEENGAYSEARLTVELEYIPPSERVTDLRGKVKQAVASLEDEDGADAWEVVELVSEGTDTDPQVVDDAIDTLRTKGEVYEPNEGKLRTT